MQHRIFSILALGLCACAQDPKNVGHDAAPDAQAADASIDGNVGDANNGDAGDSGSLAYLHRIESADQFAALATQTNKLKFLVRASDGNLPGPLESQDAVFSNSVVYPLHIQFLRSLPGLSNYTNAEYAAATQRRDGRKYAPGSLLWFPRTRHPNGVATGVMAYTISVASDQAPNTAASWGDYDSRLGAQVSFPSSDLVLVGVDPSQEAWLLANKNELAAVGVTTMSRAELGANTLEVYSAGETYGYVNIVEPGMSVTDYGKRDILIADAADEEISVVSGLITTFPQSFGSHLNLRMREKELPNFRYPGVRGDAALTALDGALVHLTISENGALRFERATLEEAEAFWRTQQPPLTPPEANLSVVTLGPLASLHYSDSRVYGVKTANLGEIFHALPAPYRPDGFGIPFSAYAQHIQQNGLQANIDALLLDPQVASDRLVRIARLDALRRAIGRAPLASGFLAQITDQLRATYGASVDTTYIRFRSSTNAEDLQEFSGAGLYDSKTGCLADDLDGDDVGPSRCLSVAHRTAMETELASYRAQLSQHPDRAWLTPLIEDLEGDLQDEKPVADAIRKVWRSLWNLRAFEERDYYGIDHRLVFMGIAVVPTMVLEQSETVAFTNLGTNGQYRLVTQKGEIGVVRPSIPSAFPEEMTFLRSAAMGTSFNVVRRSSESPNADLWSQEGRERVAALLIQLHDYFEANVYPNIRPLRLDVELDVDSSGIPIFKQARPYLGETL